MPLSDMKCRTVRPGPKLRKPSDGGGLHLRVQPSGSRLWRLAFRFGGKQKLLALGAYPAVSLADARRARDAPRVLLAARQDPSEEREPETPSNTFRGIAEEYISRLSKEGRAAATISKTQWLLSFALPIFDDLSINKVDAATVLKALRR
jgi:Arm domain-containing DNA-binding protein